MAELYMDVYMAEQYAKHIIDKHPVQKIGVASKYPTRSFMLNSIEI